ncbi:MAG: carboxypeptidase-like regulatory domain-containing protein [Candidatus Odinarchaeota archaeon]
MGAGERSLIQVKSLSCKTVFCGYFIFTLAVLNVQGSFKVVEVLKLAVNRTFVLLLIIGFGMITGMNVGSVDAAVTSGKTTYLTAWPDNYHYMEGQLVRVDVSVWDENGQAVTKGDLGLIDLNGSTGVFTVVATEVTQLIWLAATDGLTGIHIFELTYSDASGEYNSAVTTLKLLIGSELAAGSTEMILEMDTPVFNVAKGQFVNLTGILSSGGSVFPYFYFDQDTAYLSIEAEIEGSWRIIGITYPSTEITMDLEFSIEVALPVWVPTGVINARCNFSGSFDSDLAATYVSFAIYLLSVEKSLVLVPEQYNIERNNLFEEHALPVEIQVPGFDGEALSLDINLLTVDGVLVKNMLYDYSILSYSSQIFLEFSQDIAIGNYNLSAKLLEPTTRTIIATASFMANVEDDLLVDNFYWNLSSQQVLPGQDIQGYLVAREEDTFTGTKANLTIELKDEGQLLFSSTTDDNGYIPFLISIPGDISPGFYDIDFQLTPLPGELYLRTSTETYQVVVKQETSITHHENQFLTRGKIGWFNATVIDDQGFPVPDGSLSLTLNGELFYEFTRSSINYQFILPKTVPRGINTFSWHYSGSGTYQASEQSFPVTVYSTPAFSNVSISNTEIYPGDEIEITGKLTDENGEGIADAVIVITHLDNWGNTTLYNVIADGLGFFSFTHLIDNEAGGIHSFLLDFKGLIEDYYLPVEGKPAFDVSILPQISLFVAGELIAGENGTLEIQGKPNQDLMLEILEDGNWYELDVIRLDDQGMVSYKWVIASHLRGESYLRAGYTNSEETAVFSVRIKVRPQIEINTVSSIVLVGEEVSLLVTSSENHSIYLDGYPWQTNLLPGSRYFSIKFAVTGDHEFKLIAEGIDVVETTKKLALKVREDYSVAYDMPSRAQRAIGFTMTVNISSKAGDPLEGFSVELLVNGTLMATTVTSQSGTSTMTASLNSGYYEAVIRITPLDESIHVVKELVVDSFIVYSVPVITITEFQPVKERTFTVTVTITDGLTPVAGELVEVYLKNATGSSSDFIGSGLTNDQGTAGITWEVTQESGDYLLQVENKGNDFLKSLVITKAIQVLDEGPLFELATIVEQDPEKNLYLVTAAVEFTGNEGNVYLCSGSEKIQIANLQKSGSYWIALVTLQKGSYDMWLRAVDTRGVDTWYDLGTVIVINELPTGSETSGSGSGSGNTNLANAIRDTALSIIFLTPVAGYLAYKKRKGILKS